MDALENLLEEHRIIVITIALLNDSAKKLQSGQALSPEFFGKVFDVLKNLVDKCHHGKEEDALFPLITKQGAEEASVVSVLLEEHKKGRTFVRAMGEAVNNMDNPGIIKNINGYTALLLQHIKKENMLFPTWINVLSDEIKKEMSERFEEIEARAIGPGKQQEYLQTVKDLRNEKAV